MYNVSCPAYPGTFGAKMTSEQSFLVSTKLEVERVHLPPKVVQKYEITVYEQ